MQILLAALFIVCFAPSLWAADVNGLIQEGMRDLKIDKGSPGLLALTNATYVKVNGITTEGYVEIIQETTGCSQSPDVHTNDDRGGKPL